MNAIQSTFYDGDFSQKVKSVTYFDIIFIIFVVHHIKKTQLKMN